MFYYQTEGELLCSFEEGLPFVRVTQPEAHEGVVTFLCRRDPANSRASFAITTAGELLCEREGVFWLDANQMPQGQLDPILECALSAGRLRGVNLSHPRWRELVPHRTKKKKKHRINLLAVGDVGSTLIMGLLMMGGDLVSEIGICDLNPNTTARWEYEFNQIAFPWDYDRIPPVHVVNAEQLFDADVVAFCATKAIPAVGSVVADVRMAQFEANRQIVAYYARLARRAQFQGLFAVVSDPVDPLAKTVFLESNKNEAGELDWLGLRAEQVQGFGLGVMNARAAYFAKRDARFASFLTEGRSFGPHGEDLVIANSVAGYDDALSKELTTLAVTANLKVREVGFTPYVAPAFSSGAISLLLTLRGEWHCSSTYLGGVFMGAKNRFTDMGLAVESLPLPPALFERIQTAADHLAAIC